MTPNPPISSELASLRNAESEGAFEVLVTNGLVGEESRAQVVEVIGRALERHETNVSTSMGRRIEDMILRQKQKRKGFKLHAVPKD